MSSKQSTLLEFPFTLPKGLLDAKGRLHRQGSIRLATAKDELMVQGDRRVQENSAYAVLVYLSRVITRLGSLSLVTPQILEDLTILDLAYLREFYNRINQHKTAHIPVECPHCQKNFKVEMILAGESSATLQEDSKKR